MDMGYHLAWRVPILMYHRVVAEDEGDPAYPFSIPVHHFRQQMRALQRLRIQVVALDRILDSLEHGRPLPRRSVVLTFDDGFADTYRLAAPLLEAHHFPATVFLVADRMGGRNDWDPGFSGTPLMRWQEARELTRRGFTLGSHTRTHAALPALNDERLWEELCGSRRLLEEHLDVPVRLLAYPYNRTDARCQAAARAAGYRGACAGGRQGYHPWCLDRVDVTHAPLPLFATLVSRWGYASFYALSRTYQRARLRRQG